MFAGSVQVVQGYKFNVFYPDLIDKKIAPEYSVEADPKADQFGSTCILRFNAGPPYEVNVLTCLALHPSLCLIHCVSCYCSPFHSILMSTIHLPCA